MTTPMTREQRAWLRKLGSLVGEEPVALAQAEPDEAPDGNPPKGADRKGLVPGQGNGDEEPLVGFGPQDIPGQVVKKLLGPLSVTCFINNNTQQTLKLDAGRDEIDDDSGKTMGIAHGEYQEFPPCLIKAEDQSSKFVAVNKETDLIIVSVRTAGVEGFVRYLIDEQKTAWVLHFNNPRAGDNTANARIEGPNAAQFESPAVTKGGGNDAKFLYVLNPKGGAGPQPKPEPNPNPAPASETRSSCLITVTNQTDLELTRVEAEHERGDFMVPPPRTLAPNTTINFASVETPGAKEQGCKGFISWEVGSPAISVWRIEWDNPEAAKNDSNATLTPKVDGLRSQDVIGQGDENVTVSFALSGKPPGPGPNPGPGPGPGPAPGPTPEPDVPFEPPVEAKQPTLRKGDKSPDGWVEYAQMLLNFHLKTNLKEDGDFGNATLAAVLKFQKENKLQVDGTLGNQTWAALREGAPEKPSTDGRKPHTFVEKGAEARWMLESQLNNRFQSGSDLLRLAVQTVGDTPIDAAVEATVRVTAPGAKPRVVKAKVGTPKEKTSTGFTHEVDLENFRKRFPSVPPDAPVTGYLVEAFLPKELGGDFYSGNVREAG